MTDVAPPGGARPPFTMQAAWISGHGGNDVVQIGTRPVPPRRPGEVRVRMKAATLNRVDLYMRDSGAGITHQLPQIMGLDGAGLIDAVDGVDADDPLLRPGQAVVLLPALACGRCEFCERGQRVLCTRSRYLGEHRDGTLAQYVTLPAENVFPLPAGLSFAEAAALGVNHLTAWRMLHTQARLQAWETVLIFGIGGGVSLAALQLATMVGARAIVTSRDESKLERALALGASAAIHGGREDIAKRTLELTGGRGVDVVIENVGAAVWSHAMKALVRGGRLVTCGATTGDQPGADLRRLFIRQLQIYGSTLGNPHEFRDLLRAAEGGRIRPVIDSTYPLNAVHAALDRLESGRQFGKVVVDLA